MNIRRTVARLIYQEPEISDELWEFLKNLRDSSALHEVSCNAPESLYYKGRVHAYEVWGRYVNRPLPNYIPNPDLMIPPPAQKPRAFDDDHE